MSDPRKPWWAWGCRDQMTDADLRNIGLFNLWALAWMAAFILGSLAIQRGWVASAAAVWVVAILPSVLGVVACFFYLRFLRGLDELQRKVQLEGLALGFGAGVIFMMGYALAERAGAPRLDVADPLLVMVVFWAAGQWLAARRYQ